jgi:hypothetical protein
MKMGVKESLTRDFLPLVYFIEQCPYLINRLKVFSNMASISRTYLTKAFAQRCPWHHFAHEPHIREALADSAHDSAIKIFECATHSSVIDTAVQPTLSNICANDSKHFFLCGNLTLSGCTRQGTAVLMTPLCQRT